MIITKPTPFTKEEIEKLRALESLSMDLMRIAISLHRGSYQVAERFVEEAKAREKELVSNSFPGYVKQSLNRVKICLMNTDAERTAEDILMYSILFQNYARQKLKSQKNS